MKSFSYQNFGRVMFLALSVCGLIGSTGGAQAQAQEAESNLRTQLELLRSRILYPFDSTSGMAADGSLPSNIRPSVGDPFASFQSRILDASQASVTTNGSRGAYYLVAGTNKVHFSVSPQNGEFSFAAVKSRANSVANAEKKSQPETFPWDDKWYKRTLLDSGNEYLLLFWHDWTANTGEWAAIKNTPQAWYVYSSQHPDKLFSPGNAKQLKFSRTITKQNQRIDIDIYNPDNTGGYTSNHILFGFGW